MVSHFSQGWDAETLMPLVAKSGLGWIRDGVRWADIEKEEGRYQIPEKAGRWISKAREHGLHIILVLNRGNPIYEDQFDAEAYSRAGSGSRREGHK